MLTHDRDLTQAGNQSVPLEDYDAFSADRPLVEALSREGADWALERARALGTIAGSAEVLQAGRDANAHKPELRPFDRFGHRIDEVDYHPAYHRLMRLAVEHELHALPWRAPQTGAHVARPAMFMTLSRAQPGHGCPISMT